MIILPADKPPCKGAFAGVNPVSSVQPHQALRNKEPAGKAVRGLIQVNERVAPNLDVERLSAHHRLMARIRAFEETALEAHAGGQSRGRCIVSIGQEAVAAGVCANLRRDDL